MTNFHRICLVCGALVGFAADATQFSQSLESPTSSPGSSMASAIEVCMPAGERKYLSRLVCSSGESPQYQRVGSLGAREADDHVIDGYEVVCGNTKYFLYFDMYHCSQLPSSTPPAGFALRHP